MMEERTSPACEIVFFEDGYVEARVREAGGGGDATDAGADDEGGGFAGFR